MGVDEKQSLESLLVVTLSRYNSLNWSHLCILGAYALENKSIIKQMYSTSIAEMCSILSLKLWVAVKSYLSFLFAKGILFTTNSLCLLLL